MYERYYVPDETAKEIKRLVRQAAEKRTENLQQP